MSSNAIVEFVKCLLKGFGRKPAKAEDETPAEKLSDELFEYGEHFQKHIHEDILKIPLKVMECEEFFITFLNSVCTDICKELPSSEERKFFAMFGFLMNFVVLTIAIPCYRLMHNVGTVLIHQLQKNASLKLDSEGKVAFENLVGKGLELASDRHWICQCLSQYRAFIPKAVAECPIESKVTTVANRLAYFEDFGIPKSADGDSSRNVPCPFCSKYCKANLLTFLTTN